MAGVFGGWDDLIHGTVVAGAALPLGLAAGFGWWMRPRFWPAVAAALAASFLWLYGFPTRGFTSDDAPVLGLIAAAACTALGGNGLRFAVWAVAWAALAWVLYPAWLAESGGAGRRLAIAVGAGTSVAAAGWIAARGCRADGRGGITAAGILPALVGLSSLLAIGGAAKFAQGCGAVAATAGAACLLALWRTPALRVGPAGGIWGMLWAFGIWCGWYFAELNTFAAAWLLAGPVAAWAARLVPLPRRTPFSEMAWDGVASGAVTAAVVVPKLMAYAADAVW